MAGKKTSGRKKNRKSSQVGFTAEKLCARKFIPAILPGAFELIIFLGFLFFLLFFFAALRNTGAQQLSKKAS